MDVLELKNGAAAEAVPSVMRSIRSKSHVSSGGLGIGANLFSKSSRELVIAEAASMNRAL